MTHDWITNAYYALGALALCAALIRVLYTWFRDYDNTQHFVSDLALIHIPYINNCLGKIADKLDIALDQNPPVNFTYARKPRP
jgi:hypothetical protein